MSPKIFLCVAIALVAVGALLAGSAFATPITDITNPSFESDVLSDNSYSGGAPTGWTRYGSDAFAGALAMNPQGSGSDYFTNAGDDLGPPVVKGVPQGGDGANVVKMYKVSSGTSAETVGITQNLTDTLQVGTYTLTVAVGELGSPSLRRPWRLAHWPLRRFVS